MIYESVLQHTYSVFLTTLCKYSDDMTNCKCDKIAGFCLADDSRHDWNSLAKTCVQIKEEMTHILLGKHTVTLYTNDWAKRLVSQDFRWAARRPGQSVEGYVAQKCREFWQGIREQLEQHPHDLQLIRRFTIHLGTTPKTASEVLIEYMAKAFASLRRGSGTPVRLEVTFECFCETYRPYTVENWPRRPGKLASVKLGFRGAFR